MRLVQFYKYATSISIFHTFPVRFINAGHKNGILPIFGYIIHSHTHSSGLKTRSLFSYENCFKRPVFRIRADPGILTKLDPDPVESLIRILNVKKNVPSFFKFNILFLDFNTALTYIVYMLYND